MKTQTQKTQHSIVELSSTSLILSFEQLFLSVAHKGEIPLPLSIHVGVAH